MAWRLATIQEMAADLQRALGELEQDGRPALADVLLYGGTRSRDLARVIESVARTPAAIVVPGPATLAAAGARSKRQMVFHVYVAGAFTAGAGGRFCPLLDLADAIIRAFQPAASSRATQRVLNGVIWEPTGHGLLDLPLDYDVVRISLEAIDFMQERNP